MSPDDKNDKDKRDTQERDRELLKNDFNNIHTPDCFPLRDKVNNKNRKP